MQSSEIQAQVGSQKHNKNFASSKNTPGSITTSKLGQKAKNLQNMKNHNNINTSVAANQGISSSINNISKNTGASSASNKQ